MSGALVLRGEAGIGKTALLDYAAQLATGATVIRVVGYESERELPFAALHRVVMPLRDRIDTLDPPQRRALESAFGLISATPPAPLMIGLATLSLLAGAATDEPLLCIVDDAQWVDRPSMLALGFVGRRLLADGIVLLLGVREGPHPPAALEGLPQLELRGLDQASAEKLLATRELRPSTLARLIEETAGNPLALIELAGEPEPPSGAALWSNRMPLTPRLEALFVGQARALPADAQTFLLLAAAEPGCHVETLLQAARHLQIGVDASAPAEAEGLLILTDRATFRHPLIRAAVYAAALDSERRRVHHALAMALDAELEPDRRAWHRAVAAVAPDDAVADELERSAARARARAGYATESASLERAAALTSAPQRRAHRLLQAAGAARAGGDGLRAYALLDRTAPLLSTALLRAQAQRLHGATLPLIGRMPEAPQILADAARQLEPLDNRLARDTWLEALGSALPAQPRIVGSTLVDVAHGALAAPRADSPTLGDVLLSAFAGRIVDGPVRAAPDLRAVIASLHTRDDLEPARRHLPVLVAMATQELWDNDGMHAIMTRLEHVERRHGSTWLRVLLIVLGQCAYVRGEPAAADAYFFEAREMARSQTNAFRVLVDGERVDWLAWQGAEPETRAAAEAAHHAAREFGVAVMANLAEVSLAVLENGHGRYQAALAHVQPLFEADPFPTGTQALPEVVEAAARCGDLDTATAANARLSERSLASRTPWALSLRARCSALLADGDAADRLYREALAQLARTRVKTDLARTHLLYGEWLRRQRRRMEAREHLRAAYEQFTGMRCAAFAERARLELLATGAQARTRTRAPETVDGLTPRETQIARLAAHRATNSEIAAQLFISESTVAYHLRKIFRKLNVTSRRDLQNAHTPATPDTYDYTNRHTPELAAGPATRVAADQPLRGPTGRARRPERSDSSRH